MTGAARGHADEKEWRSSWCAWATPAILCCSVSGPNARPSPHWPSAAGMSGARRLSYLTYREKQLSMRPDAQQRRLAECDENVQDVQCRQTGRDVLRTAGTQKD